MSTADQCLYICVVYLEKAIPKNQIVWKLYRLVVWYLTQWRIQIFRKKEPQGQNTIKTFLDANYLWVENKRGAVSSQNPALLKLDIESIG
jgi:hypothetical protein